MLEIVDPIQRLRQISEILAKEIEVLSMQQKIQAQAKGEMDKTQREYFLREQLKAIQKELGELDERAEEVADFRKRIKDAKMPEKVLEGNGKATQAAGEDAPGYGGVGHGPYLPGMDGRIALVQEIQRQPRPESRHEGLERGPLRPGKGQGTHLEYLAVRKLKEKMKGPILCFVGPPGVGKTSLGKSIARALGREFVRISLGGVRDEAEIRGHRRTYVGALPAVSFRA